jgi:hypothetical protein
MAIEATLHVTGQPLGAAAFGPAFVAVGLIALVSIVPLIYLERDAGDELSGRRRPAEVSAAASHDR